jgi:DNA invertase Pin-like site-specific DNA recombinase
MDKLMLSMLGAFAEYERTLIRERQREGIAKAKERGVYRGRQQKITDPTTFAQLIADATARGANKTKVAVHYGVSRETLYKYISVGTRPSPR